MVVRASALLALAGDLAAYYAFADRLEPLPLWGDVAVIGLGVIPATFALVYLALPLRTSRLLLVGTIVLIDLAVYLELADHDLAANFVKLAAATGAAWFFLRFFEDVSWIVLVAFLIIPIDAISVARGPTRTLIEEQPHVFDYLSLSFPAPGREGLAQLGLPDVLFFALFLGAADRFGLRRELTWAACTLSFTLTLVIGSGFAVEGVPGLPLLSAGFLAANGDLLWGRLRARRTARPTP
jgi:hypothetical protein